MGGYGNSGQFNFGAGVYKVVGRYCPSTRGTAANNLANNGPGAANVFQLTPFIPAFSFYSDQINFRLNLAGAAGTKIDVGIYSSISNSGFPQYLLTSAAGIPADVGGVVSGTININFAQGVLYWVGVVSDGAPSVAGYWDSIDTVGTDALVTSPAGDMTNAHVYGTIPAIWPYAGGTGFANLNNAFKFKITA